MRAVILGLAASLLTMPAMAGDYLRGGTYEDAPSGYRWTGWYVGGQVGYANVDFGFGPTTQGMAANILRSLWVEEQYSASKLPNLPRRDARGVSYGGFVGYNAAWGDVVLGVELNYNRVSVSADSSDDIGRAFTNKDSATLRDDVRLVSTASAQLTDYASLRFRAGYAMDWLMPYGMIGWAVGRGNYTRGITVNIIETDNSTTPPTIGALSQSDVQSRRNAITFGFAAGGGVEMALTQHLFLRGEYEYVYLAPMGGIDFHLSTLRFAGGFRF